MTIPAMMMMGQLQKQPHREAAAAVNSENLEEETVPRQEFSTFTL